MGRVHLQRSAENAIDVHLPRKENTKITQISNQHVHYSTAIHILVVAAACISIHRSKNLKRGIGSKTKTYKKRVSKFHQRDLMKS